METHTEPEKQPITLRDVLRAIFFPPQEEPLTVRPVIPTLWPAHEERAEQPVYALPDDINTPGRIVYQEGVVQSAEDVSPVRLAILGIGTIIAIVMAYLAQSALSRPEGGFGGVMLFGIAALVWISLLVLEFAPPDGGLLKRGPTTIGGGAARPLEIFAESELLLRGMIALSAAALSAAAYYFTAANLFTAPGTIAWALSVILWMVVAAERSPQQLVSDLLEWLREFQTHDRAWLRPRLVPLIAFLLIMAAAIFFRVYRLDAVPNEMTSDHVEKLLDANDVSNGIYHVFFARNGGREAFQFYFLPLVAQILGTGMTFMTLKIASVLEALALIPLLILLGREIVDRETGFFTAGLVAISWWHTLLGRLALRIVLTPLVFTLIVITLSRGIRSGQRKPWLWAGFWMGVGAYAYQALRITPLVAVAALVIAVAGPAVRALVAQIRGRPDAGALRTIAGNIASRQGINLLCAGLVALAIFVPMLRVWHDYPQDLWNRVINRTTESEVALQGEATAIFLNNYVLALKMFNVKGDVSWFSAVPNAPMLDTITGGLFLLGLMAWIIRLRLRRDPVDAFVILAGMIMLLPSALAIAFPNENPSATRGSATLPIIFLIAAWPLTLLRQRWRTVMGRVPGTLMASLLIVVLFAGAAALNYHRYFVEYAETYRHAALNPGEVAEAVREVIGEDAPLDGLWLQGWPHWHDYRAIGIEAGDITFDQAIFDTQALQTFLTSMPEEFEVRPLVFIVHPQDETALRILADHFPEGHIQEYDSDIEGRDFLLFVVPEE